LDEQTKELLDTAAFVFLRDGVSLQVVQRAGVKSPVVEFGPDGAFAADVRNDEAALDFLHQHGLEEGRFICFLPHLRFAPYWRVKPDYPFDEAKHRRNEAMKEHDHAPLREAITAIVRQTSMETTWETTCHPSVLPFLASGGPGNWATLGSIGPTVQ